MYRPADSCTAYKANKDSIRKALKDEEDWRKKDLEERFDLNMVRRNRAPE